MEHLSLKMLIMTGMETVLIFARSEMKILSILITMEVPDACDFCQAGNIPDLPPAAHLEKQTVLNANQLEVIPSSPYEHGTEYNIQIPFCITSSAITIELNIHFHDGKLYILWVLL